MRGPKPRPLAERIAAKVDTSGGPHSCHPWTGAYGGTGTPSLMVNRLVGGRRRGGSISVRKAAWELVYGPVPLEHLVMVTCGNRNCINVRHMTLKSMRAEDMFWSQVQKTDGCWIWTGYIRKAGYGAFMYRGRYHAAHRFSYEFHYGEIEGHVPGDFENELCVCHHCDNPPCVRPDHLFLGRDIDNQNDAGRKGRRSRGKEHAEKMARARMARVKQQRISGSPRLRHSEDK